jgi:hypothetical protein
MAAECRDEWKRVLTEDVQSYMKAGHHDNDAIFNSNWSIQRRKTGTPVQVNSQYSTSGEVESYKQLSTMLYYEAIASRYSYHVGLELVTEQTEFLKWCLDEVSQD